MEKLTKPVYKAEDVPTDKQSYGKFETKPNISAETFNFFSELLCQKGFTEYNFVNEAYKSIPDTTYVVRRENPENILQLLEKGEYAVTFADNVRYSNCVEWKPSDGVRNIQNAYLEGYTSMNNVVTVVGFYKREADDITHLSDSQNDFHDLNRTGVRSFRGNIDLNRVAFISLRIPGHLLPEEQLTEDEQYFVEDYLEKVEEEIQARPVMVHRAFIKSEGGE